MKEPLTRISLILSIFLSCSAFADHTVKIIENMPPPQLGQGYSLENDSFKGVCLTSPMIIDGTPTASFNFNTSVEQETLAKQLGFALSGRAQIGPAQVSMAADFLKKSASDAYSVSAIYTGSYLFNQEVLSLPPALDRSVQGLVIVSDDGTNEINSPKKWQKNCGDMFVASRQLGAKLFFSIRIEFSSIEEKESMNLEVMLNAGLYQASVDLHQSSATFSKKAKITVTGLQIGGDVTQLTTMFAGHNLKVQQEGASGLIECSMGDFAKCHAVLTAAADYAGNIFPRQLNQPGGKALLSVNMKPYDEGGGVYHKVNTPERQLVYKQDQEEVGQLFDKNLKYSVQTNRLLDSPLVRLSPRQREIILAVDGDVKHNQDQFIAASKACFDNPEACRLAIHMLHGDDVARGYSGYLSILPALGRMISWSSVPAATDPVQIAVKPLKQIDPNVFFIQPETFVQYCDLGLTTKDQSSPLSVTIKSLLGLIRVTDNHETFFDLAMDKCLFVQNALTRKVVLDLNHVVGLVRDPFEHRDDSKMFQPQITDLRPLATLTQLEELSLSGNQIVDVSPLKALTNLRKLNLSKNQIQDAGSLKDLQNLDELDLSENQLRAVDELSDHPRLSILNLSNNRAGIRCPFVDPSRCSLMDYRNGWDFLPQRARLNDGRENHLATLLPRNQVLVVGGCNFSRELFNGNGQFIKRGQTFRDGPNLNQSEIYDINAQTCTQVPELIVGTQHSAISVLNDDRVLILGGFGSLRMNSVRHAYSSIWINKHEMRNAVTYEPQTRAVANYQLLTPRAMHTATKLADGTVLVAGGASLIARDNDATAIGGSPWHIRHGLASVEIFDPVQNRFTPSLDSLNTPRAGHTATLLENGDVLFTGGRSEDAILSDAEIYESATSRFVRIISTMDVPRYHHQATLLTKGPFKGKVLITGGYTELGVEHPPLDPSGRSGWLRPRRPSKSAELFDPATHTFQTINFNMIARRAEHTATVLENGSIFLAGGVGSDGNRLCSTEVFDFSSSKFFPILNNMRQSRACHTATHLSNGRVLLIGGEGEGDSKGLTAEVLRYPSGI